jgi:hypothetical protein
LKFDVPVHRLGIRELERALQRRKDDVLAGLGREHLLDELRSVSEIPGEEVRAPSEAAVALRDVVAEAGLAHLAVADDVDAVEPVPHHPDEVVRAGEAAGVGCQDAVVALLHDGSPLMVV